MERPTAPCWLLCFALASCAPLAAGTEAELEEEEHGSGSEETLQASPGPQGVVFAAPDDSATVPPVQAADGSLTCPLPEPDYKLINGKCVPSCGRAGGNACTAAGAFACQGEQSFVSHDCAVCCRKCDRATPPSALPVIHYYGMFQGADGNPDDALNTTLIVPNTEVIFGVGSPYLFDSPGWRPVQGGNLLTGTYASYPTCGDFTPEFQKWRGRGAKLGKLLTNEQLEAWLDHGTAADRIERILRYGWDYVVIDEIGGVAWRDSGRYGPKAVAMLNQLGARGLSKKIIFWVNPTTTQVWYDPAVHPTGAAGEYKKLLAACQQHCKRLVWETYPQDSTTCSSNWKRCLTTFTAVSPDYGAAKYLEWTANRLSNALQGTNRVSLSGLGLGNLNPVRYLNVAQCDLVPYRGNCPQSPGSGGLHRQFSVLHGGTFAKYQCGVAFYGHTHAAPTTSWSLADLANHLRNLTSWWSTHGCR